LGTGFEETVTQGGKEKGNHQVALFPGPNRGGDKKSNVSWGGPWMPSGGCYRFRLKTVKNRRQLKRGGSNLNLVIW